MHFYETAFITKLCFQTEFWRLSLFHIPIELHF